MMGAILLGDDLIAINNKITVGKIKLLKSKLLIR